MNSPKEEQVRDLESLDGGDSWTRISADNDFPEGPDAGRIGLSYTVPPAPCSL